MDIHDNSIYDDARLIRKSLTGDLTEEEKALADRLLEDGRMKRVYDELSDGRVLQEELDRLAQFSGEKAYERFRFRRRAERRRRLWRMTAVAAVCVLALGSVAWLFRPTVQQPVSVAAQAQPMTPGEKQAKLILASGEEVAVDKGSNGSIDEAGVNIQYENGELVYTRQREASREALNELQVPRGGECCITLDDGTKVWVNAESTLKYPVAFAGDRREVTLEGEAFFEVTKDSRPFVVKNPYGQVKVLGTSFGVSAYTADEISYTTLVTGKVEVDNDREEPLTISPGEQVVALKDGRMSRRKVDVDEYVGWRDGNYVFREQRLETIMNTLQRWYNLQVEYRSEELKGILFTGSLNRYDDVNVFFKALKSTRDVFYTIEGNTVTLYQSFTN